LKKIWSTIIQITIIIIIILSIIIKIIILIITKIMYLIMLKNKIYFIGKIINKVNRINRSIYSTLGSIF